MKYAVVVNKVNEIFGDYPGMKLTLRQIFYRLVANHGYPNIKSSYGYLSQQLVRARKRGDIDETRMEDRSRRFIGKDYGWDCLDDFVSSRFEWFFDSPVYHARKMWTSQPEFVMIWLEKDALSSVVSKAADRFNVITCPSRGYSSYTYLKEAIQKLPEDKAITILHLADHDPSGIDMTRDLADRIAEYSEKEVAIERVALNFDQTQQYYLPPNPFKRADPRSGPYFTRYGRHCWELDAIEPQELQRLVSDAIQSHIDFSIWDRTLEEENEESEELETMFSLIKELLAENGYNVPPD